MSNDVNQQEPVLTGGKQTMSSWSKIIESYDAIPVVYRSALDPQLANSKDFPHIVLIPPLDKFLRKTNQKLICDSGDSIQILERSGSQVIKKSYPYQTVAMLEFGSILLRSWISIYGPTSEGVMDSSTFEFNTVSERHFSVFINKIRPASIGSDEDAFKTEQAKFDHLSSANFKFMNYGRGSLVMGQKVLQTTLQPEIREPAFKLLGWTFYRTVLLAHLTILTDRELIFIRDDEQGLGKKGVRHGGIWQYIPLRSIDSTSVEEESPDDLLTLVVNLSSGHTLKKSFAASGKTELENLRDKLQR
jgi:hypothetical protein